MTKTKICYLCGGKVNEVLIRKYSLDTKEMGVIVLEDVPASVCQRCGAKTFPQKTAEMIESIVTKTSKPARKMTVPVYSLKELAIK